MRGVRTSSKAWKTADIVIVAARRNEYGRVRKVQACPRDGPIWHDVQILDRERLIDILRNGDQVYAGAPTEIEGDFELFGRVMFIEDRGIIAMEENALWEELPVPQF